MQAGRPPDLEVIDVLGLGITAQLVGDALQRLLCLHACDGVVEVLDVLGLAWAVVGGDHSKTRPPGKLLRSGNSHRAIEVAMQLGLLPAEIRRRYVSE